MKIFLLLLSFILIVVLMAWYLISQDKGPKEPIKALWLAFIFGMFGALAAGILEKYLIVYKNTQPGAPDIKMVGSYLVVGIIEELVKFLPFAIYVYKKKYFNEHSDGVLYFAIVGLGFGLPENLLYVLNFGSSTGIGRLFLTPFFHATTVALVGYYLSRKKLSGGSFKPVVNALALVIVLHAIYDFGLSSGVTILTVISILITAFLSINLFSLYYRSTELDQLQGIAEVGINRYCRHCGRKNSGHHLYCTYCGYHA